MFWFIINLNFGDWQSASIEEKVRMFESMKHCPTDKAFWDSFDKDYEKLYAEPLSNGELYAIPFLLRTTFSHPKEYKNFDKLLELIGKYCNYKTSARCSCRNGLFCTSDRCECLYNMCKISDITIKPIKNGVKIEADSRYEIYTPYGTKIISSNGSANYILNKGIYVIKTKDGMMLFRVQ